MKKIFNISILFFLLLITFGGVNLFATDVTVTVNDHNGNGITGAAVKWSTGSWHPAGTTVNGTLTFDIPDLNFSKIAVTYNQGTVEKTKAQSITDNYAWQTVQATVKLIDDAGSPMANGRVDQGGGFWQFHGNTDSNGELKIEFFPGKSYKIRMTINNTSEWHWFPVPGPIEFQTGKVERDNIYSGTIKASIGGAWVYFWPSAGSYAQLLPGTYKFVYSPDPGDGTIEWITVVAGQIYIIPWGGIPTPKGTISGTVSVNGNGLSGVQVTLSENGNQVAEVETDNAGYYSFDDVIPGVYKVEIVEPLGYSSDENTKTTSLEPGGQNIVDFLLTQQVVFTAARSKGYWKHQFNVYLRNKGHAQESVADLHAYISGVHEYYTVYFPIFDGLEGFDDWLDVLTVRKRPTMFDRAKSQLAALVLNFVSLKIGQYTIVTSDDRTAGDVLTYVSDMLTDTDLLNDELAKDLAEMVNVQQTIDGGIVPVGTIIYKNGLRQNRIDYGFGTPVESFALYQNYPNPFNPTTTIVFTVPETNFTSLEIFNLVGQKITTLFNGVAENGKFYRFEFDASEFSSGIYIYRIQSGEYTSIKKMMLMK